MRRHDRASRLATRLPWPLVGLLASATALAAPSAEVAWHLPGETWAGEDIAEAASDADYNDVAVYYSRRCTFGAGAVLAGESLVLRAVAAGASKRNALVVTLPGVPETVTLVSASGATSTPPLDGQRVTLFPDFRQAFTNPSGTFLNTTGAQTVDAPWWRLDVTYADGQPATPGCGKADFAIARPTEGVFIDGTSTLPGSNLPLTGSFPGSFQVPAETMALTTAYPEAAAWLQGRIEGCDPQVSDCHEDWYLAPEPAGIVDRGDLAVVLPLPPQPTCADGVQNAEETGIDCGGVCPGPCGPPPAAEVYDCDGALVDTTGLVVHQIEGTIDHASLMGPGGPGQDPTYFAAPGEVIGWYAFDPTVAPSATYAGPEQTEYTFAQGQAFVVVWSGAAGGPKQCLQTHPTFTSDAGQIYVQDDPSGGDRYVLSQFFLVDPHGADGNYGEIFLTLDDPSGAAISGMSLPTTPPAVGAFPETGLYLTFRPARGAPSESAQGTVTALAWADPPSCSDGMWNGGETDIDCGGPCAPCPPPNVCHPAPPVAADCDGDPPVGAGLVVHHFEGPVTSVNDPDWMLGGSIPVGSQIRGWYAFDPSKVAVPYSPETPNLVQYPYVEDPGVAEFQMVMRLGSACVETSEVNPGGGASAIYLADDYDQDPPNGGFSDGYSAQSGEVASWDIGFEWATLKLELTSQFDLAAITGVALPLDPPLLAGFESRIVGIDLWGGGTSASILGEPTTLCR